VGIENPTHLLFIAAVALIFLGPKRLPELARAAGRAMRDFRAALNGEEDTTEDAVAVDDPVYQPVPADASGHLTVAADDPAHPVGSADAPDRRSL
jgi:sec-independent protein translocase protein TatA